MKIRADLPGLFAPAGWMMVESVADIAGLQ
jgi:hypothetical protein